MAPSPPPATCFDPNVSQFIISELHAMSIPHFVTSSLQHNTTSRMVHVTFFPLSVAQNPQHLFLQSLQNQRQ